MTTPEHPDLWILLSAIVLGFSIALVIRLATLHYARKRGSAMAAAVVQHCFRRGFRTGPGTCAATSARG